MALPPTPVGYVSWNSYIELNAPALADEQGLTLQEAKASLKLLYVAEPVRQAVGTPSYRIYNQFTTWADRTVSPTVGRPWREEIPEPSILTIDTNDGGGLGGWADTALSVSPNPAIGTTYTVGSTITFSNDNVATITQIDDYSPVYIDIFWDIPQSPYNSIFPISLTN